MASDEQIELFKAGIANDLRNVLIENSPVDTGRLKGSIKVKIVGDELIIEMVDYALNVEYGTAPHIIRPKNAKALKFKGKQGETVFAKSVNHPGTRPNPFIRKTFKQDFQQIVINNAELHLGDADVEIEV